MQDIEMPQEEAQMAQYDVELFEERLRDLEVRADGDSFCTGRRMIFGNTGLEYAYVTCRVAADLAWS